MPKIILRILIVLFFLGIFPFGCNDNTKSNSIRVQDYAEPIRVACVGDSITFGAGIKDRSKNSYPAQLGKLLGEKWNVRNFGVSGATLLKKGNKPYGQQQAFQDALSFQPHVVIIKLGTNDTKPPNWQFKEDFTDDLKDMVNEFTDLPSQAKIWICLPVPAYSNDWGIRDTVIRTEVIPVIRKVAQAKHLPVIDLYQPFRNQMHLFPDNVHPNAPGAFLMAKIIYQAITGEMVYQSDPDKKLEIYGDITLGFIYSN